jgi:hypothetical protein
MAALMMLLRTCAALARRDVMKTFARNDCSRRFGPRTVTQLRLVARDGVVSASFKWRNKDLRALIASDQPSGELVLRRLADGSAHRYGRHT